MPGRDAPERPEPRLEAAGVGVHVLDVEAAIDVLATAGDDRNMQDALRVREGGVGIATVADENGVFGDQGLQDLSGRRRREIVQDVIGRGAAAVACDQNDVVVIR